MEFRTKRQLAIILVMLGTILLPIGVFVYVYAPRPTCEDNKQNQGEAEPDCGGPCIPCALKHPEDISTFWVRSVLVRENIYDVVAEIKNPNLKLGSAEFEYEFRFFDTENVLVAKKVGTSFIFPGETMHLVEASVETLRTIQKVALTIGEVQWVFTDVIPPDVVVGDKKLSFSDVRPETTLGATLINRSLFDFREVVMTALIFDESGNVIASSKTAEKNIKSGETRPIFFSWPRDIKEKDTSVVVEARVNTLNRE